MKSRAVYGKSLVLESLSVLVVINLKKPSTVLFLSPFMSSVVNMFSSLPALLKTHLHIYCAHNLSWRVSSQTMATSPCTWKDSWPKIDISPHCLDALMKTERWANMNLPSVSELTMFSGLSLVQILLLFVLFWHKWNHCLILMLLFCFQQCMESVHALILQSSIFIFINYQLLQMTTENLYSYNLYHSNEMCLLFFCRPRLLCCRSHQEDTAIQT